MCGRFVQRYTWDDIQDLYELPDGPARNLQAHYNVAPTDVIRDPATERGPGCQRRDCRCAKCETCCG